MRAVGEAAEALLAGDEDRFRRMVMDLYLAGRSMCSLCDDVIAAAFHHIGDRWNCGEIEVYQERRACEICQRALFELRTALPPPPAAAPAAIGGTLAGDEYRLPTTMAELALREAGWKAESLGTSLPIDSLRAAILATRPRLFWLSLGHLASPETFLSDYPALHDAAVEVGAAVVVGGQALTEELRDRLKCSTYCRSFRELTEFASSLWQAA